MDNEDDAHLFHGLIQLKNKSNTNESVLDTTEDEEDEEEKYSIFAEPKSKKVISFDQIQYEPKSEVDNWYNRESLGFREWIGRRTGPSEVKFAIERYYFMQNYERSLELCQEYLEFMKIKKGLDPKKALVREILEMASLCCIKLGKKKEALEFTQIHEKHGNKDPGHYYFRGNIYRECHLNRESITNYISYLKQRKNDTQVWHYLGRALYQLSFEMYPSLNRMNINHPQPISEPFGIEPVNEEAINTLNCTYVVVYTAMSCQYKAKAVIDSSANPNSPDFVKLRREKRLSDLESHISTLLVFLNHFKQPCPGFSQILVHENTMLVELQKSLFLGLKELDKDPKTTTNGIYTKDIHDALHWICDNIYLASDKHVDNSFSSMVDDL